MQLTQKFNNYIMKTLSYLEQTHKRIRLFNRILKTDVFNSDTEMQQNRFLRFSFTQ